MPDFARLFEDDLNKKLNNKNIRVHVRILPVSHEDLIPALLEGRGDAITAKNIKVIRKPSRLYVFCSTCSTGRRSSIEALEKEVAS